MNEEEFWGQVDGYKNRREQYAWTKFLLIVVPLLVMSIIVLYAVWTAIWD